MANLILAFSEPWILMVFNVKLNLGTCVLDESFERIYVKNKYGNIPCGVILLRGENIAIVGEIDEDSEKESTLEEIPLEDILELQKKETIALIEQRNNWKKMGIHIDKSIFNWFIPYSFLDEN
uniref:U6 snRNA-associated Sm-like protein LSm1 (Trinotate prediction) n=1 Tax=Myxobolus squamalis TaxID=59785 RepID=A0A6B2G8P0_MYXSQ